MERVSFHFAPLHTHGYYIRSRLLKAYSGQSEYERDQKVIPRLTLRGTPDCYWPTNRARGNRKNGCAISVDNIQFQHLCDIIRIIPRDTQENWDCECRLHNRESSDKNSVPCSTMDIKFTFRHHSRVGQ